jgi:NAD(P)-dependent dehydrogenase (short-subunit alcohol dehydrogenase family)
MKLKSKVALITVSSQGIGQAIAQAIFRLEPIVCSPMKTEKVGFRLRTMRSMIL